MKLLIISLLLVAVFQTTKAAVASERVVATRDQPNTCVRSRDQLTLSVGEVRFSGCTRTSCRTTDGQLYVDEESCGVVSSAPGCRRVENTSKNYPHCCPQVTC